MVVCADAITRPKECVRRIFPKIYPLEPVKIGPIARKLGHLFHCLFELQVGPTHKSQISQDPTA